jgi:hypothetical protein
MDVIFEHMTKSVNIYPKFMYPSPVQSAVFKLPCFVLRARSICDVILGNSKTTKACASLFSLRLNEKIDCCFTKY